MSLIKHTRHTWLLTHSHKSSHISPLLRCLHWLPVPRFHFQIFSFMDLRGEVPTYISDLLQPCTTSRALRSTDRGRLMNPGPRLKTKGDCAFQFLALKLWNSLPLTLCTVDSWRLLKGSYKLICSDRHMGSALCLICLLSFCFHAVGFSLMLLQRTLWLLCLKKRSTNKLY